MQIRRTRTFAPFVTLLVLACGHHTSATPASSADVAADSSNAAKPGARAAAPAPCSLVSAAQVGAIVGKPVVSRVNGEECEYSLDPTAAQARGGAAAASGSVPNLASALGQGGDFSRMLGSISNQLLLTLRATRDGMTEAQVRDVYEQTGQAARRLTQPESRGLSQVIRPGDEIRGIGDWAFATNIAAVNMGFGLSSRGRILEAGKGPWHVTLSVNISPDPGPETLDHQLGAIVRAVCAKLPS
jgi:hypothetical protein